MGVEHVLLCFALVSSSVKLLWLSLEFSLGDEWIFRINSIKILFFIVASSIHLGSIEELDGVSYLVSHCHKARPSENWVLKIGERENTKRDQEYYVGLNKNKAWINLGTLIKNTRVKFSVAGIIVGSPSNILFSLKYKLIILDPLPREIKFTLR